jgi:hypothetical protein
MAIPAILPSMHFGFTPKELRLLRPLTSPKKIQDFINRIPINFQKDGPTCLSPRRVLRERRAQCVEGALLAAAILRLHGHPPLIMELKATAYDFDHMLAIFKLDGCFGAISKTNHGVLRYREPVYRTVRELAMSYFHEYFMDDGEKTLRSYSKLVDLSRFDRRNWMTSEDDLWDVYNFVDSVKHFPMLTRSQIARLRKADVIERKMGKLTEWNAFEHKIK